MDLRRAIPIVPTTGPEEARAFYEGFLGFRVVMEEDGLLMFASPAVATTQVIAVWPSPTAMDQHVLAAGATCSIEVSDVGAAHADAVARGLDVVYGPADEPWGVRRFFVRAPGGAVVNVAGHLAEQPVRDTGA